jgi:hypothetical protein
VHLTACAPVVVRDDSSSSALLFKARPFPASVSTLLIVSTDTPLENQGICGKMRFHLNNAQTRTVNIWLGLRGAAVRLPKSPWANEGETGEIHRRYTGGTPEKGAVNPLSTRLYRAGNTLATPLHHARGWHSHGFWAALLSLSTQERVGAWRPRQQAHFATANAIAANTVYFAAYRTTSGRYREDDNYLSTAGVENPSLHALANGVLGGDGAYACGASSMLPNKTYNVANCRVGVVSASP